MVAPASLEALPVHRTQRPGSVITTHVLLRVRAGEMDPPRARPKLTAVLVLDASSSMEGEPIQQVVRTAQRLTKLLSAEDRLAVVSFADGANVVAPRMMKRIMPEMPAVPLSALITASRVNTR